jgi:hypothetical protein
MSMDDENNKMFCRDMLNELNNIYNNKAEYRKQLLILGNKNNYYIAREKELIKMLNEFQKINPDFNSSIPSSSFEFIRLGAVPSSFEANHREFGEASSGFGFGAAKPDGAPAAGGFGGFGAAKPSPASSGFGFGFGAAKPSPASSGFGFGGFGAAKPDGAPAAGGFGGVNLDKSDEKIDHSDKSFEGIYLRLEKVCSIFECVRALDIHIINSRPEIPPEITTINYANQSISAIGSRSRGICYAFKNVINLVKKNEHSDESFEDIYSKICEIGSIFEEVIKSDERRLYKRDERIADIYSMFMNICSAFQEAIILDKSTQSKTENPIYDENYDFGLNSQNLIWERIRKAKELMNLKEADPIAKDADPITKEADLKEVENLKEADKYPVLNALFKVNPLKRKEIIKEIFNKSKNNITELAKLDSKYTDNYDVEVEKEADRLLNVYLKSH